MAEPTPLTNGCPRWIKILLGLSLALNLAIGGLVAGVFWRTAPMREAHMGMGYAAPYVIALPKAARHRVFDAVRDDETLPKRKDRKAQYAEMLEALRQDPFDPDRVQTVLEKQSSAVNKVQGVSQDAWLSAVSNMSAKERADYVDRVQNILRRGNRGKPKDRK